jgi:uncharacterized protein (TIGR03435 family)
MAQPFTETPMDFAPVVVQASPMQRFEHMIPLALGTIWLCGMMVVLAIWGVRWRQVSKTLRLAVKVENGREWEILRRLHKAMGAGRQIPLLISQKLMEPGMFGIFRPLLIWPERLSERLDDEHIEAILAHELRHARRKDNLTAVIHMVVEAAFWFHPLVWWMERRMVEERERACDEAVVEMGSRPGIYAESLLKACRFCVESPLVCVSGITGADLSKRVLSIMTLRLERMGVGKKVTLAVFGLIVIATPILLGQSESAHRMMLAAADAAPMPLRVAAHAMLAEEQTLSTGEIAEVAGGQDAGGAGTDGQESAPAFDVADVHYSYHRYGNYVNGGDLMGDRYILNQAAMLDLIGKAYDVDRDHILGGPLWLEADRFDLLAKAPAGTSKEKVAQMLQTLLADRFKLVAHTDTRVMPAYVLSLGKDAPKLKQVDAADQSGCAMRSASTQPVQVGPELPPPEAVLFCNSVTMQKFAETLHDYFGRLLGAAVVDSTGLKGTWDLEMHMQWSPGLKGTAVLDAVKSQLGLKLEAAKTPQRVVVVDSVERKPTPNSAEVARQLPPADLQFEVAVIRPAPPGTKHTVNEVNGLEALFRGATMQYLIMYSYNVNEAHLVDIPPWFLSTRWDITAKAPVDPASKNPHVDIDIDDLKAMFRSLLADRFKLKMHTEMRPADGWVMVASAPKMKKAADTDIRPTCSVGQGLDGKDPRIANPILTGLISCRNVSMAEFADRLSTVLSDDFQTPVVDQTGLTGRYDLQLSYTKDMRAAANAATAAAKAAASADGTAAVADPGGAISLLDALSRQLGLKFEQKKRPMQVLVLDHIEETPTEN